MTSRDRQLVRGSLDQLPAADPATPFRPGVATLCLNEGLHGPFPAALAAMERSLADLNRYPNRGSYELVAALAARYQVGPDRVVVTAGADAAIGYVCQAVLDAGDEIVTSWPSFPSFVRDAQKRDAVPILVPLVDGQAQLERLLSAITAQTRLVFLATPNNPTGLAIPRDDLIAFVQELPAHVLPVIDEAYFEYLQPPESLDSVADLVHAGYDVLVLRTFSKLYGLAGLRVGYAIGPTSVVAAMRKVQRGYDVGALAQAAALASLGDAAEVERRRSANLAALAALTDLLRGHGLDPLPGSEANFVLLETGADADQFALELLRHDAAVQSGTPFGAPTAVRISAGSAEELARLDAALAAVLAAAHR